MKHMRTIAFIILLATGAHACTTAIVSGKATPDGRPLLLKHRDSEALESRLVYFTDGRYPYIGLVNASDTAGAEVWAGCNSVGFAIMNSASYNLNVGDTSRPNDQEGEVMKRALQSCATVEDFERLLLTLPRPMGVEANFGVIDALGGAAVFETGNFSFVKFDANDPTVAPFGYLIRTNYSFTGQREQDRGLIRYAVAEQLFYQAALTNDLSVEFMLHNVSRCLRHGLTGADLTQNLPADDLTPTFVHFADFIPRYSSSSSIVVQGVRPGESPSFTTMWAALGFPLCTVAIPVWVAAGPELPKLLAGEGKGKAPLCSMALQLKERCFPFTRDGGRNYLNLAPLINAQGTGIMQRLRPLELKVGQEATTRLQQWRRSGLDQKQVHQFYRWIDDTVSAAYRREFGL